MRNPFLCFLLSCSVGVAALAQQQKSPTAATPTQESAPSDVTVVKYRWSKDRINWEGDPFGGTVENFEDLRRRRADERRVERARAGGNIAEAGKVEREMRSEQIIKASRPPKPPRYTFTYKLSVKNTGEKTIKEIDWDYVFTDAVTRDELGRLQFTGVEKIAPGKSKELTSLASSPPAQRISVYALDRKERDGLDGHVVIVRVLYTDGSVWEKR